MPRKSESLPPQAQAQAQAQTQAQAQGQAQAHAQAQAAAAGSETASPNSKTQDKKDKGDKSDKEPVSIEDLSLPRSIITRLAKGILPPNTQIQGNAILALSKSATVFISYLAAHANENTVAAGKKTVSPTDVLKALDDVEFGFLKERLEAEFKKFNAIQTEKRTTYRQKVKAAKTAGDDTEMADASAADLDDSALPGAGAGSGSGSSSRALGSGPRAAKKQRLDRGDEEEDDDAHVDEEEEEEEEEDDEEEEVDEEEEEEDEEEEEEGDEDEDGDRGSADETQDVLEEREGDDADDADEALDGDDSD